MSYFLVVIRNVFFSRWAYKFNLFLESIEFSIGFLVQILVWIALFASVGNGTVAGYNLSDLITYTIISRLAGMAVSAKFAMNFSNSIHSGDIAMNFIRPYPPRVIFIFQSIGNSIVNILIVGLPLLLVTFFLIPGMQPPASGVHLLFFLVAMLSGLMINICFELLSGVLAFWRVPGDFLDWYYSICFYLLSGAIVPLWFYPEWLVIIAKMLPFQAAFFIPAQIYMGELTLSGIINALFVQLAWILILFMLQEYLWRRGVRRLTILGG